MAKKETTAAEKAELLEKTRQEVIAEAVAPAPVEEVDETLKALEAQFGVGKAFKIVAEHDGKTLVGYYRYPEFKVKREAAIKIHIENDKMGGAETILWRCFVSGDNLFTIEDIRVECCLHILYNVQDIFDSNVSLKKTLNTKPGN